MAKDWSERQSISVLGLMSGTSLDGLDLCLVDFHRGEPHWSFEIKQAATIPYTQEWQEKLRFKELSIQDLQRLDQDYGLLLGQYVQAFLEQSNLNPQAIDLIASHGHTWFHKPEIGEGLQIGNGPELRKAIQIPVVCDFRRADLTLGGQGAPLVPIGDRDLFPEYQACLNLGGFANISFDQDDQRIAFDIAPCNLPLNHYCRKLGLTFDEDGYIAATHAYDAALWQKLNQLEYYQQLGPKSLGVEWLHEHVFIVCDETQLPPETLIATLTEHSAYQIARCLNQYQIQKVLLSGGGSYNQCLIDTIGKYHTVSELAVAPEPLNSFKEALIFAYLGLLRVLNQDNVLASVTGAKHDHCSGKYYP